MFRFFFLILLIAHGPFSIAADLNESSCNASRSVGRLNGPKPILDKSNPSFANPGFEYYCYSYAKKLIRSATGHDNNLSEVEGVLETLLRINPASAYAHMGTAELQMKTRGLGLADCSYCQLLEIYRNAVSATRTRPILPESFVTLGKVDLLLNCLSCAERDANKAKELGYSGPELSMLKSSIYQSRNNLTDAKSELIGALSAASPLLTTEMRTDIHLRLSQLNAIEKNFEASKKELDTAASINPENPVPHLARGEFFLFWMADADAATKSAMEANRVKPTVEGKRLQSFAEYLAWAKECSGGSTSIDIKRIIQTSFVSPEEAFVDSARHRGLSKIAEAMLKAGIIKNMEVRDSSGNTALVAASIGNNIDLARTLVNAGANVNAQNNSGRRPLSFFVSNGNVDAVKMLLKAKADVNYVDVDGSSPLSLAVFAQNMIIMNQLIDNGGSLQSVIELAQKIGIADEVEQVLKALHREAI